MSISKRTSFVSEHSVEYAVVSAARRAFLEANFSLIPLYFWSTREGGRESRVRNGHLAGPLIAVFPRRPRVHGSVVTHIEWKINAELFAFAREARAKGIPSFAALPVATDLLELNAEPQMYWLSLDDKPNEDVYLTHHEAPTCALKANIFVKKSMAIAVPQDWQYLIKAMEDLRPFTSRSGPWFRFAGGYKPIYMLFLRDQVGAQDQQMLSA